MLWFDVAWQTVTSGVTLRLLQTNEGSTGSCTDLANGRYAR